METNPTTPLTPRPRPASSLSTGSTPKAAVSPRPAPRDPAGLVTLILVLARWIQSLALGIWTGSVLTLGAVVAPTAFRVLKTPVDAGQVVGPIVKELTELGIVCGGIYLVMLFIHDPLWARYHRSPRGELLFFLKFLVLAVMLGASAYMLLHIFPVMDQLQAAAPHVDGKLTGDAGASFDHWHKLSEKITMGIFGAGVGLLFLTHLIPRRR